MTRLAWGALLALACAGCGGGMSPAARDTTPTELLAAPPAPASTERPRRAFAPPERIEEGIVAPAPVWNVALSDEPSITVEDRFGRKVGAFDLSPVIGRGYEELAITVMARKIGQALPPEAVRQIGRASCRERV